MSGLETIGWRAEALAWDAYQGAFRALGLERASDAGAALFKVIGPRTATHAVARVNMQIAFPDAHRREIDQLLDRMWDNFGRLAAEFPNSHRFDLTPGTGHVEVTGREHVEAVKASGRPAIFISGHFANWELMAAVLCRDLPGTRVTYRHANNPIVDRRIIAQRQAYGIRILAPKGGDGAKEVLKALKAGDSVALMNDQKMNDGIAAPLFGREAMTASGPTRLAMKHGAPLVPMSIQRVEGVRHIVRYHAPIEVSETPDRAQAVLETVTRINRFVEDQVRAAPAQWFWVHRRFGKDIYRIRSG